MMNKDDEETMDSMSEDYYDNMKPDKKGEPGLRRKTDTCHSCLKLEILLLKETLTCHQTSKS